MFSNAMVTPSPFCKSHRENFPAMNWSVANWLSHGSYGVYMAVTESVGAVMGVPPPPPPFFAKSAWVGFTGQLCLEVTVA